MEFSYLHEDSGCDCLEGATSNCVDYFARRVSDANKSIKPRDYRPGKRMLEEPWNDCPHFCSVRSISINIWNDESEAAVKAKFTTTLQIAPKFRDHLQIFKIKDSGGLVKHTPVAAPVIDPYHYDLYKPDHFEENPDGCLEFIKLVKL